MTSPNHDAVRHTVAHILHHLREHRHRDEVPPSSSPTTTGILSPLFVAIQGPQGCGKTYLASQLRAVLESPPHSLSVAIFSIDDLYLPHAQLVSLAETHPENALLQGRGQPGTHDVELGKKLLQDLQRINEPSAVVGAPCREVIPPSFDKSLYGGTGDRIPSGVVIRPPVDVVIMEGWCVGFRPITIEVLEKRWAESTMGLADILSTPSYRKEDVLEINKRLGDYVQLWDHFTVFIQIKPISSSLYTFIYKWRLQQEQQMKLRNGGKGMSDEEVHSFVDRYIPGYVFFGDGVTKEMTVMGAGDDGTRKISRWIGNGIMISIGESRNVLDVTYF